MRRSIFFAALVMSLICPPAALADGQLAPTQPSWWNTRDFKDIPEDTFFTVPAETIGRTCRTT